MATYPLQLDRVFHALSDPTRLAVVERLVAGPATVSELGRPFDMARPSFLKHLRVLEDAGVVTSKKKGRVRTVTVEAEALERVDAWVKWHRGRVEERLDRLGEYLATENSDEK